MDNNVHKFLFETKFDDANRLRDAEPPEPTFDTQALDAARDAAREQGRAAGEADALRSMASATKAAIAGLDAQIADLREQLTFIADQARRDGIAVAMAATRALFPRLAAAHGMQEIEAVVAQCLELARHEPAIVFKFHPDTLEFAGGSLEEMAAARAYPGKLVLLADAKMTRDGCAAEWADGGADRDSDAVLKRIDELVAEAIGQEPAVPVTDGKGPPPAAPDADTQPDTFEQEA